MKTLLFILFIACASLGHSQNSTKESIKESNLIAYKWEGFTRSGVRIFGVAPSNKKAEQTIQSFITRNWKNSYRLIQYSIQPEKVLPFRELGYFKRFYRYCPNGYRILSSRDLAALDLVKMEGIPFAAAYFYKTSKMSYKQTENYLSHLYHNISPYRIGEF